MSTEDQVIFCDRTVKRRKEFGLSQSQLGNIVGVTSTTIGYWESGKHFPSPSKLNKLSLGLETSPSYLTGETDDPTPSSFTTMRRGVTEFQEESNAYEPDQHGRPRIPLHPKTLEKCHALMDDMECLTPEEVVSKLVNVKFDEVFPGKRTPIDPERREGGTETRAPLDQPSAGPVSAIKQKVSEVHQRRDELKARMDRSREEMQKRRDEAFGKE